MKIDDLPFLAKWKLLLLENRIDVDPDIFNNINVKNYKLKYAIKKPTVINGRFIDLSNSNLLVPQELIIKNSINDLSTLTKVGYNKDSPFLLKYEKGNFILKDKRDNSRLPLIVELVKKNSSQLKKINVNGNNFIVDDYAQLIGLDRIGILCFSGCIHWNVGKSCLFCDSNPKRKSEKTPIPNLNDIFNYKSISTWWNDVKGDFIEGLRYSLQELLNSNLYPHTHIQLMAGNLPNQRDVWTFCEDIVRVINNIKPLSSLDSYLNIAPPAINYNNYLKKAKEWGFKNISFNLEVIGEDSFKYVCPGKMSQIGYKNMLNALKEGVNYFDWGNVRTNFVLGAQKINKMLEGIKEIASYGIVSDYSIFTPKKGTPWSQKTPPSLDDILYFSKELIKVYNDFGFRPIYCRYSSRSNILHELIDEI